MILFYLLFLSILTSAMFVVTLRNVFHSALFLVITFFLVAGIYLTLDAEFLAAVQVLIYVGAVTILILFAIMLTHKIQSRSIRQVNEQVIPAAIICAVFLVLAAFTIIRTFGSVGPKPTNFGSWTATLDTDKLPSADTGWNWTVNLEDTLGHSYVAAGNLNLRVEEFDQRRFAKPAPESNDGYILSSNSDFSTSGMVFARGQNVYMKVWSDGVDYSVISEAIWTLTSRENSENEIAIELANSNTETTGRLLMSKFVLPFEVVSVLLLAALIGAIIMARKDD